MTLGNWNAPGRKCPRTQPPRVNDANANVVEVIFEVDHLLLLEDKLTCSHICEQKAGFSFKKLSLFSMVKVSKC